MSYSPPFATAPSAAMIDAMTLRNHVPIHFAYLDWAGEIVALHNQLGDITVGGVVFKGIGALGEIQFSASEGADISQEVRLNLQNIPDGFIGKLAPADLVGGRGCVAWGLIGSTGVVIPTPVFAFAGQIDGRIFTVERGQGNATKLTMQITLSAGDSPAHRISQRRKPTDGAGWRHLADMANEAPTWPSA